MYITQQVVGGVRISYFKPARCLWLWMISSMMMYWKENPAKDQGLGHNDTLSSRLLINKYICGTSLSIRHKEILGNVFIMWKRLHRHRVTYTFQPLVAHLTSQCTRLGEMLSFYLIVGANFARKPIISHLLCLSSFCCSVLW